MLFGVAALGEPCWLLLRLLGNTTGAATAAGEGELFGAAPFSAEEVTPVELLLWAAPAARFPALLLLATDAVGGGVMDVAAGGEGSTGTTF